MTETRKIAAILVSDVVGYSRLVGADEDRTLARLRALRSDMIDPTIAVHHGRVVKRTGDGAIVEFRSVIDAVRCAIEVQSGMVERNAGLPPERRIEFRIGIHLGDVVEESDGDLMGDGVNIAARLEGICEVGGVCMSEDAYRQVRDKIKEQFVDLGEQVLKNIARPMRAYQVKPERRTKAEAAAAEAPSAQLALPDKPSIAVLPFQNMSGDPEQDYFADGIVEDIITALSRMRWLFVIARNSSFTYKGRAVDVKQVGRELGVRYVLEGSVRKAGNRVRITGQLIDTSNGAHLWAERYRRRAGGHLRSAGPGDDDRRRRHRTEPAKAEIERAQRKPTESLDAYDLYLRALPFVATAMPEDAEKALPLLEDAVRLDPLYATAHAMIAWCHEQRYLRGGLHEEARAAARHHARAAIAAGADDASALAMAGFVIGVVEHDFQTAIDAFDRSLALSPSAALAYAFSATIRAWNGDDAVAVAHAESALRLSPYDPLVYLPYVGLAYTHFFSGRFAEAVSAAGRALQANPRFSVPAFLRTAALASLERNAEAAASARHLLELQPGFTIASLVESNFTAPARLAMLAEALGRAGVPER